MESAEEMYSQFKSFLFSIIQKHAPLVKNYDKSKISVEKMKNLSKTSSRTVNRQRKNGVSLMILETHQSLTTTFSASKLFWRNPIWQQTNSKFIKLTFLQVRWLLRKARPYEKSTRTNNKKSFSFRFVTSKEVLHHLKTLNTSKPLRPTEIPAWALTDGKDVLMHPLTYLFNAFLFKEEKFPQWP